MDSRGLTTQVASLKTRRLQGPDAIKRWSVPYTYHFSSSIQNKDAYVELEKKNTKKKRKREKKTFPATNLIHSSSKSYWSTSCSHLMEVAGSPGDRSSGFPSHTLTA